MLSKKIAKLALVTSLAFGVVAPYLSFIENQEVFAGDAMTVEPVEVSSDTFEGKPTGWTLQNLNDGRLVYSTTSTIFNYVTGPTYTTNYDIKVNDVVSNKVETVFSYSYGTNEYSYTAPTLRAGGKYVVTSYPNNYLRKATIINIETKEKFDIPLAYNFRTMDINDKYFAYLTENDDIYIYDMETRQLVLKKNYYNADDLQLTVDGSPYFAAVRGMSQNIHSIEHEKANFTKTFAYGKYGLLVDKNTYLYANDNNEWFKADPEFARANPTGYTPEKINFEPESLFSFHTPRLLEYYNGKVMTPTFNVYDIEADDYYNIKPPTYMSYHYYEGFIGLTPKGAYFSSGKGDMLLPFDTDSLFGPSLGLKYTLDANKQVTLNWDNLEGASDYQVYKDNELVYEGADTTYIDNTLTPSTSYSYKVVATDLNGEIFTRKTVSFATQIENPQKVTANIDNNGVLNVSWDSNNPTGTEYQANVKNTNPESIINANVQEGFEDAQYDINLTGSWVRTTSSKSEGLSSLRSSNTAHSSTSYSDVTIEVPLNAKDIKGSFDYMVSSEAGYDGLYVVVNGATVINKASGLTGWKNQVITLKPGKNTIQFRYSKDGSASKNLDAAFIDNFKYSFNASESYDSGWIKEKSASFNVNNPNDVYEVTVQARHNGKVSEVITVLSQLGNSVSAEIVKGIEDIALLIDAGLANQEQIDNAQTKLDELQELLTQLPEGQEKEDLQAQLNDIQDKIDLAQDILNAKNAVAELEKLVNADLSTQEMINSAKEQLNVAQELVNQLPENHEVKVELQTTINEAQEQIDIAQATLNVINAEATPSQENYEKAIESLEQVNNEAVKSSLTERLVIVKDILDANSILDNITGTTFTSLEQIEQAIKDLAEAKAIIDGLPKNSVDNPYIGQQKAELQSKYAEAKQYLGDSLVSVLEGLKGKESKGKPERLTSIVLDFLVQHAINEVDAETLKGDRGKVVSYVSSLAGKLTTGDEINKVLEKYLP